MGKGELKFLKGVSEQGAFELFSLGTFHGPQGFGEALLEWRELFSAPNMEQSEFINPAGSDLALVVIRWGGRGLGSGVLIEEDFMYAVVRIEKGMTVGGTLYRDRAEALEAAGLSE